MLVYSFPLNISPIPFSSYSHSHSLTFYASFISHSSLSVVESFLLHLPFSLIPPNTDANPSSRLILRELCCRKFRISGTPSRMGSPENPNWVFDYGYLDDIPVPGGDLPSLDPPSFAWPSRSLGAPPADFSVELDDTYANSDGLTELGSRKRLRSGCGKSSGSKACREKLRRDRLNDRFLELGSVLDPGRPAKTDKAVILSDAVRVLSQLREEAQKLRESNENLQKKITELKAEKNELRNEKQRLKSEKDKIERQFKALNSQPGFLPRPPTLAAAPFPVPGQVLGSKMVQFIGYPGVSMWQFLPPASVDTSQDHVLRPPVA